MVEKVIASISDYTQSVCEMREEVEKDSCFHEFELLFRGQANKDYQLIPSIARNRKTACQYTIFNDERNLIEMAKYKMPEVFRNDQLPLELLALLQHHGIPTRLLDVTENALVALYFACCNSDTMDGEVIVFKHENRDVTNYPVVNAIADSYRFTTGTWTQLSHFFRDVKNQPYFLEQKQTHEVCHQNDEAGGKWIAECCEKIMYVYAPIRSMRQQVQQGRYILFPNHIEYETWGEASFEWLIKEIPKDHEDIALRLLIPKEIKNQLLGDLAVLGISKEFLFCDSIDTVCKGIVDSFGRKYK